MVRWGEVSGSPHAEQKGLQTPAGCDLPAPSSASGCRELAGSSPGVRSPASLPKDAAAASVACTAPVPVSVSLLPTQPASQPELCRDADIFR